MRSTQYYVLFVEGPVFLRPLSNDRSSILALLPVGENQDHVVPLCSSISHPVLRSRANLAVESRDISDRFVGRPWLRSLHPPGTKIDHSCDLVGVCSDDLMLACHGTASGEKCHFFRFACSPLGRTAGNSYRMKFVFTIGGKLTRVFVKCAIGINGDYDVEPVAFTLVLLLPVSQTFTGTLIRVSESVKRSLFVIHKVQNDHLFVFQKVSKHHLFAFHKVEKHHLFVFRKVGK
jgi:hypothetical protein